MAKKRYNPKKEKLKKAILKIGIFQLIVLLFVFVVIYESKPILESECVKATLTIDDLDYRLGYGEHKCVVISEGTEYIFSNVGMVGKNAPREIFESLYGVKYIEVMYTERVGVFGRYKLIIDARYQDEIYYDYNEHFSNKQITLTLVIIFSSIFEVVFLLLTVEYLCFNKREFGLVKKRKKKP